MQRLMVEVDRDVASSLIMKTDTVWGWCKPCGRSTACWEAIKSFRCYACSSRWQHILAPRMCQDCLRVEEADGQSWKLLDRRLRGLPVSLPATEDTHLICFACVCRGSWAVMHCAGANDSRKTSAWETKLVPRGRSPTDQCLHDGVWNSASAVTSLAGSRALAVLRKDQITECRGGVKASGYCTGTAA